MGPVRDTAERTKRDQTADRSDPVVAFKVPVCTSNIFGSCTVVSSAAPSGGSGMQEALGKLCLCMVGLSVWLYQANEELLPNMQPAPGPSCLRARRADSRSGFFQCDGAHAGSFGWQSHASHKSDLIIPRSDTGEKSWGDWGQASLESLVSAYTTCVTTFVETHELATPCRLKSPKYT